MKTLLSLSLLLPLLLFGACSSKEEEGSDDAKQDGSKFRVRLTTTKGDIVIEVDPELAPNGAKQFRKMVEAGYFKDIAFFRVVRGFMAQFGMHGDPATNREWSAKTIQDEPVRTSNKPGYVSFAQTGAPNSRSNQMFINLADNQRQGLDRNFPPIGRIVEGIENAFKLYDGYGENRQDMQYRITTEGNAYLKKQYPKLDYILSAVIE